MINAKRTLALATALAIIALTAQTASADGGHGGAGMMGQGTGPMMKPGTMPGGMTGQGGMMGRPGNMHAMMSHMMGGGMMGGHHGFGPCAASGELDLSAENVRDILEGKLAWLGNKRLKVGEVSERDDDTYAADIVTVDGSLVERYAVERKTGHMTRVN